MNRIEKLMKALPEGADAALITSDVNRRYFTGLGSTAGTLLAFRDAAYFIIDFRYIEVAKATVTGAEVILQDKLYDQLGELLKKHGARTVAIETDYITVGSLEQYRSRLPQVEFLTAAALNDKILEMRSLKDEEEIAAIRKAQSITDAAFLEILDFIKPGKTEKEVAAYLEYCMRRLGADGLAFETIAAGGPNSAKPHAVPGDRPLRQGDFFTMDYGAYWGGYCSDMTRTVAVGEPTEEMRRVYDTVLAAQLLGIEKAVVGEIVSIILETVCSKRKTIRIAGDDYPAELVKAKFMKLNSSHIEFVFDCMKENTTKIRNIKQYLKAVLFNAPNTIDSYYTALVAHDMATGKI